MDVMNMGCGTYLYFMAWGAGIIGTILGFNVPRSDAPMLFGMGIIGFAVAIIWTVAMITAPKREAEKKRAKKLEEQIEREQKEEKFAHMEGLQKFHEMDVDDAMKYQKGIEAMRELGVIMQRSVYQEKEKDWAILGGIADGIAGPAAGIITAANAINDNARIKAENAARREWGAKQNEFYQDLARQAERERPRAFSMNELQEKYTAILSWDPSTLFSMIKLSDTKIDIDEQTGAVEVSTSWRQDDKSICIDGALRAKIYSSYGSCVGCAYLVLPKVGTVGFKGKMSGICVSPKLHSTSYTVKIEPVDLWELALKENIAYRKRKTDNLTDTVHRKLVSDFKENFLSELGE